MDEERDTTEAPTPTVGAEPGDFDKKLIAELADAERSCQAAEREVEEATETLKEKKAVLAAAIARERKLVRTLTEPEPPLFRQPSGQDGPADDWRDVPLREALAGVTAKVLDALAEARLETVGQLADWTAEEGGRNRLTDLEGIGPAKATQIEEALEAFWARRKEDAGPVGDVIDREPKPRVTRETPLIDLVTGDDAQEIREALEAAGLNTVADLLGRAATAKGPPLQRPYTVLRGVKGMTARAVGQVGDALVDSGLI